MQMNVFALDTVAPLSLKSDNVFNTQSLATLNFEGFQD
jgi:hypothetical protein